MLSGVELDTFRTTGCVPVRGAVPADLVARCQAAIAERLTVVDVDLADPSTWAHAVIRADCPDSADFAAVGTHRPLREAFDQLLGPGRYEAIGSAGATMPVRFPHPEPAWDAVWHTDGAYKSGGDPRAGGQWWLNIRGRGKALLLIVLFHDVGPDDAPTQLLAGSHRHVARFLAPYGDEGHTYLEVAAELPPEVYELPSVFATGSAGDAWVCHPFVVHRATAHHGTGPRAIATTPVLLREPYRLDGVDAWPVEQMILDALAEDDAPAAAAG